jgi:8-oxo-dGTP pyrophosphatase MutT (NUDIX family)
MVFPGQHRPTARVILKNSQNEVFLLLTHFDPEVGLPPRWLTPGGGIDAGETALQAAVRELFEETGIRVTPETLGEPIWSTIGHWDWADGNYHTYEDIFFEYEVSEFDLDDSNWTTDEFRDVLKYRWWNITELANSGESVAPHGLVEFMQHRYLNDIS